METPLGFKCFVFNGMFVLALFTKSSKLYSMLSMQEQKYREGGDSTETSSDHREHQDQTHTLYLPITTEKRRLS